MFLKSIVNWIVKEWRVSGVQFREEMSADVGGDTATRMHYRSEPRKRRLRLVTLNGRFVGTSEKRKPGS